MPPLPLIARAQLHPQRLAIRTSAGDYRYQDLLDRSEQMARVLLAGRADLNQARVAVLIAPSVEYVVAQWAIWRAGGIFLPLCNSAAPNEWEYALTDSGAQYAIVSSEFQSQVAALCQRLNIRIIADASEVASSAAPLPDIDSHRPAMILYTSGTTSKPKGVLTTHDNIQAQIESLTEAWEWQAEDRIPLFLPLHHIHGIINILSCALWSGALVEVFSKFDHTVILERVRADAYTLFMAVPTIYVKLLEILGQLTDHERSLTACAFGRMRLMVSGSAALPASVHQAWFESTGQKLLERYGMTEIGMALSNPYHGERRPGYVGLPLPGVEVRLKSDSCELLSSEGQPSEGQPSEGQPSEGQSSEGQSGEIQVRGTGVFRSYWNRPEITAAAFDDGWFRTGDVAIIEDGYYRIMGRQSVDIIKSGGYKLSALEIEATLLEHPSIQQCAVLGLEDPTWGEVVAAAIVVHKPTSLDADELKTWCRQHLSPYKIPKRVLFVDELPRNAMGKVTKPAVRTLFANR